MGLRQVIKEVRNLSVDELETLIDVANQVIDLKKKIETITKISTTPKKEGSATNTNKKEKPKTRRVSNDDIDSGLEESKIYNEYIKNREQPKWELPSDKNSVFNQIDDIISLVKNPDATIKDKKRSVSKTETIQQEEQKEDVQKEDVQKEEVQIEEVQKDEIKEVINIKEPEQTKDKKGQRTGSMKDWSRKRLPVIMLDKDDRGVREFPSIGKCKVYLQEELGVKNVHVLLKRALEKGTIIEGYRFKQEGKEWK